MRKIALFAAVSSFALALAAVWLISQGDGGFHIGKLSDLKFPILAGVGFGCYFIFIHNAVSDPDALLWPMILSRLAGTLMVFSIVLARRESFPDSIFAGMFNFAPATLLEIPAEQQAEVRAAPKVQF